MDSTHPLILAPGYALCRATVFDMRALHALERAIFPHDAYPYPDLLLLFLSPGVVNLKIAAPDRSLAGFVCGTRGMSPGRSWIITLGVAPAHQRRGLGAFLLDTMEQRLKRPFMRLTVRESNQSAIRLYSQTGYSVVERKPAYYRDGEAGLVMEKRVALAGQ